MRHQDYIDKFVKNCDEFDDCDCYVAWLPSVRFNSVMAVEMAGVRWTDILASYLDSGHGFHLSFIVSDQADTDRLFLSFGDLPYSAKKALLTYFNEFE